MWKEFTRETPARRGLAIFVSSLAFAGTVGLAWYVTSTGWSLLPDGGVQSPANWPIVYTLPEVYSWARAPQSRTVEVLPDRSVGIETYISQHGGRELGMLAITFEVRREGTTPSEAAPRLVGSELADTRSIQMGPMIGEMAQMSLGDDGANLVAVGCLPTGLSVGVKYVSLRDRTEAVRAFEAVCASITLRQ
ncbi:MAG: hypothetical protein JXQ75_16665 [Phycisphaerae bacterium]|nr:hypothetical protein [Phycisphaerae bacterium]